MNRQQEKNYMSLSVQTLQDIEKIKILKARYCYLADAGIAGDTSKYDELLALFTDDAKVDFVGIGVWEGKTAIGGFFKDLVNSLWSYASHMVMNPIIEVEGIEAKGLWRVHCLATTRKTNQAVWIHGDYEETYLKVGSDWKWKSIKFSSDFYSPYDEGWAKTKMITLE